MKKLIKSSNKTFAYISVLIGLSLIGVYLYINRPITLECRYYYYDDKGFRKGDLIAYQAIKINKILKTIKYYNLRPVGTNEGLSMSGSVRYKSVRSNYETNYVKQKKLEDYEKKNIKNQNNEYLYPKLKNQKFKIVLHRPSLDARIDWNIESNDPELIQKHFKNTISQFSCDFPKKKKKKKYKKRKNKI